MDRIEKYELKDNYKRSTKALKNKKTYENNGKMSSKHLRIQETIKEFRKSK